MIVKDANINSEINYNYASISEISYTILKDLIIQCKFKGGERLVLNDLAKKLRMSITPIREALKKLEKDGLIEFVPNKGAVVVNIFLEDVIEIYDIRSSLECLAIQLLPDKIDDLFLEKLYKIYEDSENFLAKKEIISYQEYNKKLHSALIFKTSNKRLINIMNSIRNHMSIIIINNLTLESIEKTREHSKEHLLILDALKYSDFILAEKLMKRHIVNAKEEILNNFKDLKKIN